MELNPKLIQSAFDRFKKNDCGLTPPGPQNRYKQASIDCFDIDIPLRQPALLCLVRKQLKKIKIQYRPSNTYGVLVDDVSSQCATQSVTEILADGNLGDDGIIKFSDVLLTGSFMQCMYIDFSSNMIGDAGFSRLVDVCTEGVLSNLVVLELKDNEIGNVGITNFANVCIRGYFRNLARIDLEKNNIGNDGIIRFAEALATQTTPAVLPSIQYIGLGENNLDTKSIKSLLDVFEIRKPVPLILIS